MNYTFQPCPLCGKHHWPVVDCNAGNQVTNLAKIIEQRDQLVFLIERICDPKTEDIVYADQILMELKEIMK